MSARNVDLETAAFTDLSDVGAWRVYADWLQSVGDPRGELASLELLRRDAFRSERIALQAEIQAREQPYSDAWRTWAQAQGLTDVEVTFKHGFAHAIAGSLTALEPVLDELFERDPIQRLELRDVDSDTLRRVCQARPPWFERLSYLRLLGHVGAQGADALAMLYLPRLTRLNLLGTEIDPDACQQLARLDTPQLRALTLTSNEIDAEGLGALLESPMRTRWRELYLSSNPLDADGLARLAATTGLEQLERLYVRDVEAPFKAHEVLLDSPNLRGLAVLELSSAGYWSAKKLHERMRERWGAGLRLR